MSRASAAPTFKVLVVEDDDFQADAMKEMLLSIARSTSAQHEALGEYFHMTIAVSRTGEAAWDLLRAAHYDLAIVDIMLPGVSGLDLSWCFQQSLNKPHETELRMAPPDTDSASDAASSEAGPARPPTVLVACTSDPERVRSQLYEHGIHDLLSKPVAMADLRHILHKWMPRHKQIGTSRGAGAAAGEGTRLLNTAGLQRKTSGMFGCRILLVEDDEITRAATECLFQVRRADRKSLGVLAAGPDLGAERSRTWLAGAGPLGRHGGRRRDRHADPRAQGARTGPNESLGNPSPAAGTRTSGPGVSAARRPYLAAAGLAQRSPASRRNSPGTFLMYTWGLWHADCPPCLLQDFDMLLLDINLPGISGYALASW